MDRVIAACAFALLLSLALCISPREANARPIEVAARTSVQFDTYATAAETSVNGVLRDNNGSRLPRRPLVVAYTRDGLSTPALTDLIRSDRDGAFAAAQTLDAGTWQIRVTFEGDAFYASSDAVAVVEIASPASLEGSGTGQNALAEGVAEDDRERRATIVPEPPPRPAWTDTAAGRWGPPGAAVLALLLLLASMLGARSQRRKRTPAPEHGPARRARRQAFASVVPSEASPDALLLTVVDAEWKTPVAALLEYGGETLPVRADEACVVPDAWAGQTVRVVASGYAPAAVEMLKPSSPTPIQVELRAHRTTLLELWQALLLEVRPRGLRVPGWWGRETIDEARERLREHVRALRHPPEESAVASVALAEAIARASTSDDPSAAADALGRLVEARYFGATPTSEADLQVANRLAAKVRQSVVTLLFALVTIGAWPSHEAHASVADYRLAQHEWNGLSSFAQVAERAGVEVVERERVDLATLGARDVLWLVYPTGEVDHDAVFAYVAAGGILVLADDFGGGAAIGRAFGLTRSDRVQHGVRFQGRAQVFVVPPVGEHVLSADVASVATNHPSGWRFDARPVFAFDDGAGLLYDLNVGSGRAVFLSDASMLTNLMLPLVDNRVFIENLLAASCEGRSPCRVVLASHGARVFGTVASDTATSGLDLLEVLRDAWHRLRAWSPSPPTRRALEVFLWIAALIILSSVFPLIAVSWRGRPRARIAQMSASSDLERALARYRDGSGSAPFGQPLVLLKHDFERRFYAGLGVPRPTGGKGGRPARLAAAERWVRRFGTARGSARRVASVLERVAALPDRPESASPGMRLDARAFRRYHSETAPLLAPLHPPPASPTLDDD